MRELWWVCAGSAVGGGARHLLQTWMTRSLGGALPWGTLTVNLLGSFAIAAVMFLGIERGLFSPTVRVALTAGVLGGFTTYSSFSYETLRQLEEGALGTALGYVTLTVLGCLLACLAGWGCARWLGGR